MGCDIHAFAEVKIGGTWHCYGQVSIDRTYSLFARMAGVRNYDEVKPIAPNRGVPDDASVVVAFERERFGADGHSHSWMTRAETAVLEKEYERGRAYEQILCPFGYLFGNGWGEPNLPIGVEDARIVFWFDN